MAQEAASVSSFLIQQTVGKNPTRSCQKRASIWYCTVAVRSFISMIRACNVMYVYFWPPNMQVNLKATILAQGCLNHILPQHIAWHSITKNIRWNWFRWTSVQSYILHRWYYRAKCLMQKALPNFHCWPNCCFTYHHQIPTYQENQWSLYCFGRTWHRLLVLHSRRWSAAKEKEDVWVMLPDKTPVWKTPNKTFIWISILHNTFVPVINTIHIWLLRCMHRMIMGNSV